MQCIFHSCQSCLLHIPTPILQYPFSFSGAPCIGHSHPPLSSDSHTQQQRRSQQTVGSLLASLVSDANASANANGGSAGSVTHALARAVTGAISRMRHRFAFSVAVLQNFCSTLRVNSFCQYSQHTFLIYFTHCFGCSSDRSLRTHPTTQALSTRFVHRLTISFVC